MLLQRVDAGARQAVPGHGQRLDHAAAVQHRAEHLEVRLRGDLAEVDERQLEAQVGVLRPVAVDRLLVGDARERDVQRLVQAAREHARQHGFHRAEDVLAIHEAGFQVDLRELRLAVAARVLVPVAAGDLEVAVQPAHHQELLEDLRRLRQRVEPAGGDSRRHDEISCPFRGGAHHRRCLDLQEALVGERRAHLGGGGAAQGQVALHDAGAEVQVAVGLAQLLARVDRVADRERQRIAGGEHLDLRGGQLDLSRGLAGVGHVRGAQAHRARHRDAVLVAQPGRRVVRLLRRGLVHHHLRHAVAVAQVEKADAAVVAPGVDPAAQHHARSGVGGPQLAARLGSFQSHVVSPMWIGTVP